MKNPHPKSNHSGVKAWGALRIALIYLVVGGLWIGFSDQLALNIASDMATLNQINLIKGWGFIVITALLLFLAAFRETAILQNSEAHYRLLAENTADVIWIMDIESERFLYVSPSVLHLRGYTADEVLAEEPAHSMTAESYQRIREGLPARISEFLAGDPRAVTQRHEVEQTRRDGSTVWTEVVTTLLYSQKGRLQVLGVSRDISSRKQVEETLLRSDELLRLAYDAADLGIWRFDVRNQQFTMDERACAHYGLNGCHVALESVLARVHPEDLDRLKHDLEVIAGPDGGGRYRAEYRVMHPNGEMHWLDMYVNVQYEGAGAARQPVMMVGTSQDITEQKRIDDERRLMEERIRLSIQTSNIGFYDWDLKSHKVVYSPEWKRQLGYTENEISNDFSEWENRLHPDDVERAVQVGRKILEPPHTSFQMEFRLRHKDGSYRSILGHGIMVFDQMGIPERVVGTHLDITEQKLVEERLRQSEKSLNEAQRVAHVGSWVWHIQSGLVECSDELYRIYGIDKESYSGSLVDAMNAAIHPEDLPIVQQSNGMMAQNQMPYSVEFRVVRPDGSIRTAWAEIGDLIVDSEGKPDLLYGIVKDITEQKQAEESVKAANLRLRSYFDADLIGVMISKIDGSIIEANDYYLRLIGYSREEFEAGRFNWYDFTPEEFREIDEQAERDVAATGKSMQYEKEYLRRDGTRIWILVSKAILYPEKDKQVSFVMEITKRKQAEEELRRLMEELQRSNAELEQFAYVASHDLQEPLRTVTGMVQLLQQRYHEQLDARGEEYIEHAVQGMARMQTLVNDLLMLSRVNRRGGTFAQVDSGEALDLALSNLAIAIRENSAVITHDLMPVLNGDETQLIQVFQNLVGNAIKFHGDPAPKIHIGVTHTDTGWQFSVRDNGIGIDARYYERIFSPFQRLHTRREYQGNGIGLSICKKIIERHGGRIWVESTPGQGSTFSFTLPNGPRRPGV